MTDNPFATPQVDELPRDRWGRPLITPPDGGDPVAYTRASTIGGVLEDTYNIQKWLGRMIVLGMAKRKDLIARAASIVDPEDRGSKKTLNDIAERAKDSAAPSAAEIGSAIHAFTEVADNGGDLAAVPEEYLPDIMAYTRLREDLGLEVVSMEQFVVIDEDRVGGSYDRIYKLTRDITFSGPTGPITLEAGTHVIGDVKTGKNATLGAGKFAVQLGGYSRGVAYKHTDGSRTDLPPINQDWAIIIHLPASQGVATAYALNIGVGYTVGMKLAHAVREWRSRKDLIFGITSASPMPAKPLTQQINEATSVHELNTIYFKNQHQWTPGLTSLAASRKAELE